MTGSELAEWLLNDQGCGCDPDFEGKCNICLIVEKLRYGDYLAAKGLEAEEHLRLLRREVRAVRTLKTYREGQDRFIKAHASVGELKVAADLCDKAEAELAEARAAVDAAGAIGEGGE
jgi:hypothetical protein